MKATKKNLHTLIILFEKNILIIFLFLYESTLFGNVSHITCTLGRHLGHSRNQPCWLLDDCWLVQELSRTCWILATTKYLFYRAHRNSCNARWNFFQLKSSLSSINECVSHHCWTSAEGPVSTWTREIQKYHRPTDQQTGLLGWMLETLTCLKIWVQLGPRLMPPL